MFKTFSCDNYVKTFCKKRNANHNILNKNTPSAAQIKLKLAQSCSLMHVDRHRHMQRAPGILFHIEKIEDITERVEKILGPGKRGSILVHVGTTNAEREGKTVIVKTGS